MTGSESKNRDIPLLTCVLETMQAIRMLEDRADFERERMQNITQHLSFSRGGKGPAQGLEADFAELDALQEEHREKAALYRKKLKKAERIVNAIPDPQMMAFVEMLYVERIPPKTIMEELNLTEWGFRKAREAIENAGSMESVTWKNWA